MNAFDDDAHLKDERDSVKESKMKIEEKDDAYRVGRGLRPAAR